MTRLLFLLFWLFLLFPVCLPAAEVRSIHAEWDSYTPPEERSLNGFKLYQEGVFVCQIDDPGATAMDCTVTLASDPTNFTLTAMFADGTESPHSAPFAFSGGGETDTQAKTTEETVASPTAVLSTSAAAGICPLEVSFDASGSSAATGLLLANYLWDFGDGSSGTGVSATHVYSDPGTYSATLTVVDSQGQENSVTTPIVVTAAAGESDQDTVSVPSSIQTTTVIAEDLATSSGTASDASARLESGEIALTSSWARVSFASPFVHPIVIAGPPSTADISPCTVQIRNVASDGFDIRLAEWPYQDGVHGQELVSYLVLEQGRTVLANGAVVEAGSFSGSSKLKWVPFSIPFANIPVVLTSVVSVNESEAVAGRLLPLGKLGFTYLLREQESNLSSGHAAETVHYVAWEPGSGVVGAIQYEAFSTDRSVDHQWSNIALRSSFEQPPILFAHMQTMAELDTANLRIREASESGFQAKIQEEQSLDEEVEHALEKVGYLAISQASTIR